MFASTGCVACVLLVSLTCLSLCQPIVEETKMEQAVSHLAKTFRDMRSDQLGVAVLEAEFNKYPPNFIDVLTEESIISLLMNSDLLNLTTTATGYLTAVTEIQEANTTDTTVPQCCDNSLTSCCYSCAASNNSLLLQAKDLFSSSFIATALFQLGLPDGSLLVHPPLPLPTDGQCSELDSRLQPWYVSATSDQPRALALVVDLDTDDMTSITESLVKTTAGNIIKSLSPQDRISMTVVQSNKMESCGDLDQASDFRKTELLEILSGPSPMKNLANLTNVLINYVELLENMQSIMDRILIFVTAGTTIDYGSKFISNLSQASLAANISLQVYLASDSFNGPFAETNTSVKNVSDIVDYYSHLIRPSQLSSSFQVATAFNPNGELSLSISRTWLGVEKVLGVANVLLPWETLLESINQSLAGRPSSYLFVMDCEGNILYHDLAPHMVTSGLSPSLLEPEKEFSDLLKMIMIGVENITVPVSKISLLPRTGQLEGSFLLKRFPANYSCWKLDRELCLYTCLLLAEEDKALLAGREGISVSDIYLTAPSREPVLHSSIANLTDTCSYFCQPSANNQISLQLTLPIKTNATDAEIIAYIGGSGSLPDGVPNGVAEEVAILSSLSDTWVRGTQQPTSVLHWHVATPTGVYMRYPPLSLNDLFQPQEAVWYRGAISQIDVLALSPPSTDIVDTNRDVYSASWPLRDSNMQLLAVLAVTNTISSLQVNVNTALGGICDSSGFDCMIVNDEGFFVVKPRMFPDKNYLAEVIEYQGIVRNLLQDTQPAENSFLLQKRGCNNFENGGFSQFYWLNRSNRSLVCGTTDTYDYCIQGIPESNSFLMVVKQRGGTPFGFCFSDEGCLSCPEFTFSTASCLCSCEEDNCNQAFNDSDIFSPCPVNKAVDADYTLAITAQTIVNRFCWDSSQCCSLDQESCSSSSICSWCLESDHCISQGTCCSGDNLCCFNFPDPLPCFFSYCLELETSQICPPPSQESPPSPSPSPSSSLEVSNINTEAAIIGGVVGGIFAVFLLAMLVVCCVWYQIFRPPNDEDRKEKGVFNLDEIRPDATNQTAIEFSEKEVEPAVPGENGGVTKQDLTAGKSEGTQL